MRVASPPCGGPEIAWHHDVDAGIASARRARKAGIVLLFGAQWEGGSKKLLDTTFADDEVRWLLHRNFVAIGIDCTEEGLPTADDASRRFQVLGLPTVIVVTTDLNELERFHNPIPATDLIGALESAITQAGRRSRAVRPPSL